jgi:hypothetical protein
MGIKIEALKRTCRVCGISSNDAPFVFLKRPSYGKIVLRREKLCRKCSVELTQIRYEKNRERELKQSAEYYQRRGKYLERLRAKRRKRERLNNRHNGFGW